MRKTTLIILVGLILMLGSGFTARSGEISSELQAVLETAAADEPIPVIIRLVDTIELKEYKDPDKARRRSKLIKALKAKTDDGQKSLKKYLKDNAIKDKDVTVLWMINAVAVVVPAGLVESLAARSDVERVDLDEEVVAPAGSAAGSALPEWNIEMIRAPELWALGHDGAGIVVATLDSGVDYDHPDIGPKWRGGTNSWFDPNGQHAMPYDASGHGTWTMGLLVGGDAGGTAIGTAPGAQWIAVKIFDDRGRSRLSRIHQGFQWLLDPDGDPATNDSPEVVNNSWYLSNTVDQCNSEFVDDIAALKAAEIAVVFSAGNTGPYSASSVSPSNNIGSVAVGAIDASGYVAGFSARGPSACGAGNYPALVAPGVNVLTANRTFGGIFPDSYTWVSGTSFAAPHVSGAIALLLSVNPDLTVSELESALQSSALDLGPGGPDDDSGYGLIDVMEAYLALAGDPAAPVATDDAYNIVADSTLNVAAPGVLANDSDANGDSLTANLDSPASSGSVTLNSDGSFAYTPGPGYTGIDSFTYTASDGALNSNPATVTISVDPIPVNNPPVANDDAASTFESSAVAIDVLGNDTDDDGDALSVRAVTQGADGTVANNGGDVTYTPAPGFTGTDSFTYIANDGDLDSNPATVTITVEPAPANTPPAAVNDAATVNRNSSGNIINVAGNDYDPDGSIDASTVTIVASPNNGETTAANADGTVTYTPKKGFRGTDTFSYTVNDNEGAPSNAATVSVEVVR